MALILFIFCHLSCGWYKVNGSNVWTTTDPNYETYTIIEVSNLFGFKFLLLEFTEVTSTCLLPDSTIDLKPSSSAPAKSGKLKLTSKRLKNGLVLLHDLNPMFLIKYSYMGGSRRRGNG